MPTGPKTAKTAETTLLACVRAVWRREQRLCLAQGALAFLRWGVPAVLAGIVVDWLIDLPAPGRAGMVAVVLGVPLYRAWRTGWRDIRAFDPTRTALKIEARHGGMTSLLVTAIQLRKGTPRAGTSEALTELTYRNAEAAAGGIKVAETVSFRPLRRPAAMALGGLLVAGALALTHGPLLVAGMGRIFAPWLAIRYPTRTQLELVNGDQVVQEGKPVRIAARVSGVVPGKARIALRTGAGKARERSLDVVNAECEYRIETAFRGFEYRLMAGDARSAWHRVEVIGSPAIARAEVRLDYPAYTERPSETVETLTVTVPETTQVQWTLGLDRAVREASLNLAGQEPIPLEVGADGLSVSVRQVAAESAAYGFSWVEREHGFAFTSPSYYLQVAPDRPPHVELTSPERSLYATPGRRLDLAFRGRDDHGIAESLIAYRVDKTEEETVSFSPAEPVDGREQTIDWDYRSVLTNLTVGQVVTFAVELADRYPGAEGPHRVRSEARRVQFLSREDYLAQVAKQKQRLLAELRALYREEREVHAVILGLDPAAPASVQMCQLEAVRQDLVRERLTKLAGRMRELTDDVAANNITNEVVTVALVRLRSDLLSIADRQVLPAAAALRSLAGESGEAGGSSPVHAAHLVNNSARELGLLVLQLGYQDAAEVMARELHAAAQTQAALRQRAIPPTEGAAELAEAQEQLGQWLTRLFEASPRETESTVEDALVAFTLTRLVKQMVNGGMDRRLHRAAALVREGGNAESARLQAEVIQALLKAEFRLRVGAEREALVTARDLLLSQASQQATLRTEIESADAEAFRTGRMVLARRQKGLHRNLQLLLMPEIPARRTRLLDEGVPKPPPVADLLAAADAAMERTAAQIAAGDRESAATAQSQAEEALAALAAAVGDRIAAMTQAVRINRLAYGAGDVDKRLERLGERQLSLLEKTEDATADGTACAYLGDQEEALAVAADELRMELAGQIEKSPAPTESALSLPACLEEASHAMRQAILLLKKNKPGEAAAHQDAAAAALAGARGLLAEHGTTLAAYAATIGAADYAAAPGPIVGEIEDEQRDMLAATRQTKPEDLPGLALPQKNLVHAVDAVLVALDPIAHVVESGTVMLFAKEDMDSAGTALKDRDPVEALDAQEYIVETLKTLRAKVAAVVPQFRYILEITEALQETSQEGVPIREAQRRLRKRAGAAAEETSALAGEQETLRARAEAYGTRINTIAGLGVIEAALPHMAETANRLRGGDRLSAANAMAQAEEVLRGDAAQLGALMTLLAALLGPPAPGQPIPEEVVLLKNVLAMAAVQRDLCRESAAAVPDQLPGFEAKLLALEQACEPFITLAQAHANPVIEEPPKKGKGVQQPAVAPSAPVSPANLHLKLAAAKGYLSQAASSVKTADREQALAFQVKASEKLRHFVVEYTLKFFKPASGSSSGDPVPTDDFAETDDMLQLFMPGAVTGTRPPDGRLEWEVLGRRERAALNENFARELPLEYRAILKDYYERLAR